ncbi:MAG: glycosyltransferase [Bacteroidales bacterium]|nr:glycosyltransferase [Bacteroidales bacterium]
MIKISAVIITLNEERNIRRCLESIHEIVDEIIVIDSFSTDKTREICESYNVKFYEHEFLGYSAQKNYGIKKAQHPYILSLDADEALSKNLKKSILFVKSNWKYDAYSFNRLTNYCGKWIRYGGWYPDRKIRLWDSRKGSWGGLKVHEKLVFNKRVRVKNIKGDLLHFSYYTIDEHVIQANRYSSILARSYYENGRAVSVLEIIARSPWRFVRDYFIKLGFLSGIMGLVIAVISSTEVFLKYVKLKKLFARRFTPDHKNICLLNSNKVWGGGEKWTLDTARYLSKAGYKVLVITNKNSALFNEVRKYELELELKSIKVTTYSSINIFQRKRLKRILKAYNIGTLFLNLSNDLKFGAKVASKLGVNKIVYRRAIPKPIKRKWYYKHLFVKYLDKIITNSEQTKKGILLNYSDVVKDSFVKVIYNGIKINEQFDRKIKDIGSQLVIGSAGRLSREKGHLYMIKLASLLKEKGISFKIKIAGEGSQRKKLEKEIERLGLNEEFELIGFKKDLDDFYSQVDLFILPSIWEGFGFVLLEAMSFNMPVIAFDTGSSAEIIQDYKNGYIIPDYNVDLLTEKVIKLYMNKDLRKEMGDTGYKILKEKFSVENTLREIIKIVENK